MSQPCKFTFALFADSIESNSTIAWIPFFLKMTTR